MSGGRASIDVLVVDANWLVRLGLSNVLAAAGQFGQIAEAASVQGALAAVRNHAPDVVVMDPRLPDGDGIEACRQIRSEHPCTQVMILTTCVDEEAVIAAILAGANGYLLKYSEPARIVSALETVSAGGSVLDSVVSDTVLLWMQRVADGRRPSGDRLAEQERKILPLIAAGKTNRQIAAALFLSEHTVKTYISSMLRKLQLARRAEVAAYVARQQLVRAS